MPRPIGIHPDGRKLPVPWSQNQWRDPDWGNIDDTREEAIVGHSLCLVCGNTVVKGKVFERTATADKRWGGGTPVAKLQPFYTFPDLDRGIIADRGSLHDRCAKLTIAHCTHMRVAVENGLYAVKPYFRYAEHGGSLGQTIRRYLATHPELRHKSHPHPLGQHCYVASEAFWHASGGPDSGLTPCYVRHEDSTHWFLVSENRLVDLTSDQFSKPPPYGAGRRCGFQTKKPSKRARQVLDFLTSTGKLAP